MKRVAFLLFFTFVFYLLSSQVPQGFNYQAIARDGSGTVLSNQLLPVKITIQTSLTGGTSLWEETHSVTTNNFGIMVFVVGSGTRTGGSASLFSDIDWSAQTLFLKTEIQYPGPGYSDLGTTQIWSVPYSMVAKKLEGTVDKLGIKGTTDNMEEALFEVKNNTGQTVFAVYNEGVRIFVDDGAKGAKGGFAIGGFGGTKATPQNYFVVKPDTIRMYIDDRPGKGAKGGFAIGGFGTTKGISQDFLTVSQDSVRVYLDNTNTVKGAKGGFAIGGFGLSKGTPEEYLRVTRDSTRVYLNDTPGKGAKGGFAIGGFGTSKGEKRDYMSISPDSTNFYVRALSPLVSSTFNIVGVDPSLSQKSLLKADNDTVSISKVLVLQKNLIVNGNLDVEGTFKQAPLVMTTAASSITQTTASGGGNIVSNNGAAVILSGICWSTSSNPTILLATKTTDGLALGPYTSTITGLTASTLYYVRAYATNSIGTSYGNEISFTTSAPVTDLEGNTYNTVTIGTQTWMTENLKSTRYSDGTPIPLMTNAAEWAALLTPGYCWYNNDLTKYGNTYGAMYNWFAVDIVSNGGKNVCPKEWHVPTDADWTALTTYLGGEGIAGGKLKETGTTNWFSPNTGATNETGFNALPGGFRDNSGAFSNLGKYSFWWSSTENVAIDAWNRYASFNYSTLARNYFNKPFGFSVRCLRDN